MKKQYNIQKLFDSLNAFCITRLYGYVLKMKINLSYLHKKLKQWK
ncbi:hypothetical protein [Leptospira alexanderi]|uniref:Uncharacterized protein n=1 Tax=Leptospira alexanderi serovar Manhao 3 str. L 60 TaxID=1049759 RepID=V6I9R0_9LEPT|nr:hypothetical protein [Leptospira alexanderi]EQA64489.1 hypothetical protein LEP1GSC062_0396 [Leptospira alexanderi serovar Manhao 3 str. L 60]